jgi:phage terminase large subunit-like protein
LVGERDGILHVWPYFWTPEKGLRDRAKRDRQPYDVWVKQGFLRTTPGASVNYEYIAEELMQIIGENDLATIAFDRWRIEDLKRDADRVGIDLPLIEHGQGFKDMAPAIDLLEERLLNASLAHGMHPVLTMCAANAIATTDPAGNRKLDKQKTTGRIDGMVALIMALTAFNSTDNNLAVSPWEDENYSLVG